jgi:hypothetical protein
MRENMHLLCFWSWLTSLSMISYNCIHLPSNPMSLFLWLSNTLLCICTQFNDPFISCGASGLFPELGYYENAAMNIDVQVSLQYPVLIHMYKNSFPMMQNLPLSSLRPGWQNRIDGE